jgi:VWFA-related protein
MKRLAPPKSSDRLLLMRVRSIPATVLRLGLSLGLFFPVAAREFVFEVYVTDKKGNPITDLTVDDFEVFEDGKAVGVTRFEIFSEGLPAGREPSPEDDLAVVVFVDALHLNRGGLKQATKRLGEFLPDLAKEGTEVSIIVGGESAEVFESFTTEPARIERALDRLGKLPVDTGHPLEQKILTCILEQGVCSFEKPVLYGQVIPEYVAGQHERALRSLRSLEAVVVDFADRDGRKAILYLSDGLPLRPGEALYRTVQGMAAPGENVDLSGQMETLVKSANANRVAFYTTSSGGPGVSVVGTSASNPYGASEKVELYRNTAKANLQSGLEALSGQTGGWTAFNAKGLFETAGSDFRSFYLLGYPPDHEANRYHTLKVKVDRKKVKVRYRAGYYDAPVDEPRIR